jgi:hypothetical protein
MNYFENIWVYLNCLIEVYIVSKGSCIHALKFSCQATWKRFSEVHKKMIANCLKWEAKMLW